MTQRKKLIEVALPLEAINVASAREKSIRHGHPSTLHLWWARRPLAAARAVIFTSLVDDPDSELAPKAFVDACKQLDGNQFNYENKYSAETDTPRMRLFDFIAHLVTWESTTDEKMLEKARELILLSTDGNPPPLLDPFAGGGSIPLEAQRLGLEAHASDLNPVAVMINKAQIEIPPRFADMPPVNPRDRENDTAGNALWKGASGLAADVRYYGEWMREKAYEKIGHLYPNYVLPVQDVDENINFNIADNIKDKIQDSQVNYDLQRTEETVDIVWTWLRDRQLHHRQFVRNEKIGAFEVDFFCATDKVVVEIADIDGDADLLKQQRERADLIEKIGLKYLRLTSSQVLENPDFALKLIENTLSGETVIAWIWARTVESPNPAVDAHVPLARSFILSKKKGRECWAKPIVENGQVRFEVVQGKPLQGKDGTVNRSGGVCIISEQPIPFDYIRNEATAGRMGSMLVAIVTEGKNRRNYHNPSVKHSQIAEDSTPEWKPLGNIPEKALGFRVQSYGMDEYNKLFTERQLITLTTFAELMDEVRGEIRVHATDSYIDDDSTPLHEGGLGCIAYAEAISIYLSFAVDKLADYNSTICSWHSGRETIRNTFARQAIPMVWDYTEVNPFSSSTGNWLSMLDWSWRVLETMPANNNGYAIQQDVVNLDSKPMILSTDPPYYDNIGYADLSDYFYVWMRKSLREIYPEIFSTLLVPKEPELIASPFRHGGKSAANKHFEEGLQKSFKKMRGVIQEDYPLTVYYAFKQSDIVEEGTSSTGWETMLNGLIESRFSINGTWPVRTEMSNRAVASGTNALASSIVLVCRPRPEDAPQISRREFVSLLRQELPPSLIEMQSGNIAPVDLAQASIGPGMAVYSRYSQVLEADGTPLTVRAALQIINQELDAYLSETEGHIDADSRFAVAWFEQSGFEEGDFGQADVLARAKNTSVAGIEEAHIIESGRGKVRLLSVHDLYEMNPDWNPADDKRATTWEAVHHLIARLQRYGESGAALLMLKMDSEMAAEARQLAYRLYSICERKGWADHARDYNAIVVQWSDIQSEVGNQREALARGDSTRQTGLPGFDE